MTDRETYIVFACCCVALVAIVVYSFKGEMVDSAGAKGADLGYYVQDRRTLGDMSFTIRDADLKYYATLLSVHKEVSRGKWMERDERTAFVDSVVVSLAHLRHGEILMLSGQLSVNSHPQWGDGSL